MLIPRLYTSFKATS